MKKLNLFQKIDRLYSRVTGREHQYCIRLAFKPKGWTGQPHTWVVLPGMTYRPSGPEFYRSIRKHFGPKFIAALRDAGINPNNGQITIGSFAYLGRF